MPADVCSDVHAAVLADLPPVVLHGILELRSAVFVVEQQCLYLDPDSRDIEPDALHLWITDGDGTVIATLRLVTDPDGAARIGRVSTARSARGSGLARRLMERALEIAHGREVVLEAQAYLVGWYAEFGFVPAGDEYVEDGIPHVPMRLA